MADSVKIKALTSSDANTLAGQPHSYYLDANNFTNMPPSDVVGDTTPQLGGNLDLNSNNITGTGDIGIAGDITLTSTDAGSTNGPVLDLYRNSPSPSSGDYLGQIAYSGENSNGGTEIYAKVTGKITDPTLGSEDGLIETAIKGAGSFTIVSRQRSDELQLLNGTGLSVAGNTTLSGTLNGHTIPGGSGTLALTSDFNASTTDTLTNKTINLSSNTLSGTTAQFNTALSDGSFRVSGSYSTGEVIEELHAVCNGTDLHGRATIQNVTGSMTITEGYTDASGSLVTSYTPPSGTKMIVYEYTAHLTWRDAHAISHWRLYYQVSGGSWVEVTKARTNRNGYYPEDKQILRWVFEVDATSDDSTLGIFNAATPQLGFKWQTRDYGSGNERGYLHLTQYWDGGGTDVYSQPMIMIKAIA